MSPCRLKNFCGAPENGRGVHKNLSRHLHCLLLRTFLLTVLASCDASNPCFLPHPNRVVIAHFSSGKEHISVSNQRYITEYSMRSVARPRARLFTKPVRQPPCTDTSFSSFHALTYTAKVCSTIHKSWRVMCVLARVRHQILTRRWNYRVTDHTPASIGHKGSSEAFDQSDMTCLG